MKPTKVTAVALFVIGLVMAGYAFFSLLPTRATGPVSADEPTPVVFPLAAVLFPFAAVALGAGAWVYLTARRNDGAISSQNPAVRN